LKLFSNFWVSVILSLIMAASRRSAGGMGPPAPPSLNWPLPSQAGEAVGRAFLNHRTSDWRRQDVASRSGGRLSELSKWKWNSVEHLRRINFFSEKSFYITDWDFINTFTQFLFIQAITRTLLRAQVLPSLCLWILFGSFLVGRQRWGAKNHRWFKCNYAYTFSFPIFTTTGKALHFKKYSLLLNAQKLVEFETWRIIVHIMTIKR